MKITDVQELKNKATDVRIGIIEAVHGAKSGHPGGSLSCTDILTVLYFNQMHIDPEKPRDEARDRFILSKGHAAPALYSVLANRGYFDKKELSNLRHIDSNLQGHPDMNKVPGVDMNTGSLRTRTFYCKWNCNEFKIKPQRDKSILSSWRWRIARRSSLGSCNDILSL